VTQPPSSSRPRRAEWVAAPPGGVRLRRRRRPPRRYTGPPSYPAVPRWGFPPLAWRWPLALPDVPKAAPVQRLGGLGATAVSTLWTTAMISGLAAFAEMWRYVLLVRSRGETLPATTLAISDGLVAVAGVLTWLLGLGCAVVVVLWALRARSVAGDRVGMRLARSDWQLITGVLVPVVNLFVPGSVLAELEHTVLVAERARERGARPTPSRLVLAWWAAWAVSLMLGWLAFGWSFLHSVQAMADGVVLHACSDAAVAVLAIVTARVVKYLTYLLTPVDPAGLPRRRVLGVHGAPRPGRAARPADAPR
jgi:hypothetical protein